MLREPHGGRVRMAPGVHRTRTPLEQEWRDAMGATVDACRRWPSMTEDEQRPYRERERAALDAYVAEIEAYLA